MKLEDIEKYIGLTFGRLTILYEAKRVAYNHRKVVCRCTCGTIKDYILNRLKKGTTKSCGCIRKERPNTVTHNLSTHPLYYVFSGMKARCYNPNDQAYPYYGALGVTIFAEWLNDFKTFYDWSIANGWKSGLEIDKDKLAPSGEGKIYSPEFCCFLTPKENGRYKKNNVMLEYNGEVKCLSEWCEELNLNLSSMYSRIVRGKWTPKQAFETPSPKLKYEYNNEKRSLPEWCAKFNIKYETVCMRLRYGWDFKRAIETAVKSNKTISNVQFIYT